MCGGHLLGRCGETGKRAWFGTKWGRPLKTKTPAGSSPVTGTNLYIGENLPHGKTPEAAENRPFPKNFATGCTKPEVTSELNRKPFPHI